MQNIDFFFCVYLDPKPKPISLTPNVEDDVPI
jgi:hypothetical protein